MQLVPGAAEYIPDFLLVHGSQTVPLYGRLPSSWYPDRSRVLCFSPDRENMEIGFFFFFFFLFLFLQENLYKATPESIVQPVENDVILLYFAFPIDVSLSLNSAIIPPPPFSRYNLCMVSCILEKNNFRKVLSTDDVVANR